MEHQRLQYLINRYLATICTDAELKELTNWYDSVDYGPRDFELWIAEMGNEENLADGLFQGFAEKRDLHNRSLKIRRMYLAVSAAAILAIAFSLSLFYIYNRPKEQQVVNNTALRPIVPGKNRAVLTLADGSKVELDNNQKGNIAQQNGVVVTKTKTGQLVYTAADNPAAPSALAYNTVSTPRGGQYQIRLPDGTEVWLNAESTVKYPVRFSGTERRVELSGEAYFEVAHDAKMPFKVITNNQEIEVLGTHFNIKGYSDEQTINTTLLQGSVMVSNLSSRHTIVLKPGQQSVISGKSDGIALHTVNVSQVISWKNGYFLFDQMNINSIMKILSRWYDIDVEYNDIDQTAVFGGTFSRNADIKDILANMQLLGQVHFKIYNRKVIVSK